MLIARTLVEAQTYLSLALAADPSATSVEPPEIQPGVNLTEGEDAWTLTSAAGELTVRYASEEAARAVGARFGLGVSELVDAAQWAMVARSYADRALAADLAYEGEALGTARRLVELNWEFAAEAQYEALKFLPENADRVPDEGVWSEYGRQAVEREPGLLTRAKLNDDREYYEGTLQDFIRFWNNRS
jgi:hypothetical protein